MEEVPPTDNDRSCLEDIVDKYLKEKCLPMDTDPARFWKENEKEYLPLAQIAKDILSIPLSSAPVEHLFSVGFLPLWGVLQKTNNFNS